MDIYIYIYIYIYIIIIIIWWLSLKRIRLLSRRPGFDPWFGKIPWRR